MTGAVLLIVSLLFLAASIESLVAEWQGLRQTFRGWPAMSNRPGKRWLTKYRRRLEARLEQAARRKPRRQRGG